MDKVLICSGKLSIGCPLCACICHIYIYIYVNLKCLSVRHFWRGMAGEGGKEGGGNGEGGFHRVNALWRYFAQAKPGHPASIQ